MIKDIFKGPVFDFLINESKTNRDGWGGCCGSIDGISDENLSYSKKGNEFIQSVLLDVNPYNILETGTNYGSFGYTCYETLSDFNLYTCDNHIDNNSERCINFINSHYNRDNIKYHNKDSLKFLKEIIDDGKIQFDLAWLDSKHTYSHLLGELNMANELNIPYIMVDDFHHHRDIQQAIFDFLKFEEDWRIHSYNGVKYWIGSVILLYDINYDN